MACFSVQSFCGADFSIDAVDNWQDFIIKFFNANAREKQLISCLVFGEENPKAAAMLLFNAAAMLLFNAKKSPNNMPFILDLRDSKCLPNNEIFSLIKERVANSGEAVIFL